MSVLENILYGFVSGLTEFLPVSVRGHQSLLRYLFGADTRASLQDLLVHIGIFLSIIIACREKIGRLYREQRATSSRQRRRSRHLDSKSYYDLRLLKTAAFPLVAGMLLYASTENLECSLLALIGFFTLNGVILLIAEHTRRGNRDARTMSGLDGIAMGICGAAAVFPGISRSGMILSYASVRGVDRQSAVNWAILLGIPAALFSFGYNLLLIFTGGIGTITTLMIIGNILAGIGAFCGGYIAISILRLMVAQDDHSYFAYYAFGVAMLAFVLYLI